MFAIALLHNIVLNYHYINLKYYLQNRGILFLLKGLYNYICSIHEQFSISKITYSPLSIHQINVLVSGIQIIRLLVHKRTK